MSRLSNREIRHTDVAVRIDATDATAIIRSLKVETRAIVGEHDYVGLPPIENTRVVRGGHVSPLEAPEEVAELIRQLDTAKASD